MSKAHGKCNCMFLALHVTCILMIVSGGSGNDGIKYIDKQKFCGGYCQYKKLYNHIIQSHMEFLKINNRET